MLNVALTKITRKFQVTIPKDVRENLSIAEGDYMAVVTNGDEIILKKVDMPSWEKIFKRGEESAKRMKISPEDVIEAVKTVRSE